MAQNKTKISFQGERGAYSHQACIEAYPNADVIPYKTFQGAIEAVQKEDADYAMLPVENSTYGRVADIHQLLPNSGLHIIAEHYVRVHINLLAQKGTGLEDIKTAISHTVLLGQCREFLKKHTIEPIIGTDTAGAALQVANNTQSSQGALASELAADIYGLEVLAHHIEDQQNNTTRFLIMSKTPKEIKPSGSNVKTSFIFRVRNIPAALYKAMGGFATNSINMVKLESYMVNGSFKATQFYADIIGHPDDPAVTRALEELRYFTTYVEILGVYKAADPNKTS